MSFRVWCLALVASVSLLSAAPATAAQQPPPLDLRSPGVVADGTSPVLPEIAAASWLVADLDSGEVLAAKDARVPMAPASTLKVLTAATLLPRIPADRVLVPTFDDVNVVGSKVGLLEGVGYPAGELFAALLMVSGNDAANVLASAVGGQRATADLMNEQARLLGALDTVAVNPHGLDAEGQVSSAHDLALLARAAMAVPAFAAHVGTRRSSVGGHPGGPRIEITNKNKLLRDYPGALGIKNGFTNASRASFVGAAERDGRRLVVSLMRADPQVFGEAQKLLDWGFAAGAARPVGVLGRTGEKPAERNDVATDDEPVSALAGGSGAAPAMAVPGARLPVALAGLGLAVAAVLAVRTSPAARRRRRR